MSQEEMDKWTGPVSYCSHHAVYKPDSTTTPLRVVMNSSLKNNTCGLSPNQCQMKGPNALNSLLEVLIRWRTYDVALVMDLRKAYQSLHTGPVEKNVR